MLIDLRSRYDLTLVGSIRIFLRSIVAIHTITASKMLKVNK